MDFEQNNLWQPLAACSQIGQAMVILATARTAAAAAVLVTSISSKNGPLGTLGGRMSNTIKF